MNVSIKERFESFLKKCSIALMRIALKDGTRVLPSHRDMVSILVVRQHDQLGDMICTIPLLKALRNEFPASRITLIIGIVNHDIMFHHPSVDEVLQFPRGKLRSIPRFIVSLRKHRYDLAIVPSTVSFSFTSALIALVSGANYRIGAQRIGTNENPSAFCFTNKVTLNWNSAPHRHQALRNLDITEPLGIRSDDITTSLGITGKERQDASDLLRESRRQYRYLVGIHPGAGKKENRWPVENFSELLNRLSTEQGAGVVISIGPMDGEVFDQIKTHLRCEYLLLKNKSIREVAAVIDQVDLFISNDTGVMHVAGATSVRLLSLFGPTDPLQWAPAGKKNQYLTSIGGDIQMITVEEVTRTAIRMLSERERLS